jgi:hypothetical protein
VDGVVKTCPPVPGADADTPLDWGGATVDNWLAFAGWDNNLFSLGYARKIGGIYLGAWYNGNVVASGETTEEFVTVTYDALGNPTQELGGYQNPSSGAAFEQPWAYSNNRLGILLGIAGMGFKLDVRENYLSKDIPLKDRKYVYRENMETDAVTYYNEVSEYKYLKGWTDIYAGWGGLSIPLGGLTLKPSAQLGVQLYANNEDTEYKGDPISGNYVYTDKGNSYREGSSTSFVRPNILVAASLSGLPAGLGASLEYAINFDLYTSSYDLYGGSESVAGDVSWLFKNNYSVSNTTPVQSYSVTKRGVTIEEKTQMYHYITPALTYSTDLGDRAKFGLKLKIPFTLASATSGGQYTEIWNTTTTTPTGGVATVVQTHSVKYESGESATSIFKVDPALSLGVQFAAIPDKLTFNFGLANTIAYSSTKVVTKPLGIGYETSKTTVNGKVTSETKTTDSLPGNLKTDTSFVTKRWSDLNAQITAGFSFQFSPNFLLDTNYTTKPTSAAGTGATGPGISFGDTNFWQDIIGGNFALMFTIKK